MSKKKWIELIQPHRHAGRNYKVGETISLAEDKADWLISKKVATEGKAPAEPPAEKSAVIATNATVKKE
ncbi:hypothetical protein G7047_19095 [Diaphorobacter sp. HDW4A]|uniref:DUF7210 family protein n=1 Tax=Diaphorobacter sp. HDW4A TaxID=2714924 RepID=UPI0014074679|nr:hypothetical protein [Diaphorobacter sp. HDW4A]QIL81787.1 hypothetical protein G7047_19095 [Diaphorobacter sp. HDW4A]